MTFRVAVLSIALGLLGGCSPRHAPSDGGLFDSGRNPDGTPGLRPWPDTWEGIHTFLVFDDMVTDPTVAKHYDFVWSGSDTLLPGYRAANPGIVVSTYIPFDLDPDATETLAYWQSAHPDWVLYQCDEKTPALYPGYSNIPIDFSNPAVVAWQIANYAVPFVKYGYDALATDVVQLVNSDAACGVFRGGAWVPLYSGAPDDAAYAANVAAWAGVLQKGLHALPHPLLLVPNYHFDQTSAQSPVVQQLLANVDGILHEDVTGYAGETDGSWVETVKLTADAQSLGKAYYEIGEFADDPITSADLEYAISTYLMEKGHASGVYVSRFTLPSTSHYGAPLYYPELDAKVGHPCGAMYMDQGVYWRQYSHALVVANPSSSMSFTTALPADSFTDLEGHVQSGSISLVSTSGLVLLRAGPPGC